jgi:hypothetical protein|tara:strand:+ start:131 stop:385 length:255 start_codon:yes stop_codon:yes gene_type:complete
MPVTLIPAKDSGEEMRKALADVEALIDVLPPTSGLFVVVYDGNEPSLVAVANMDVAVLIASAFAVAAQQVPILLGEDDDYFDDV